MDRPFPNFFIVGAPKCGTTSLHQYVGEHPDAFMSDPKEPHYFNRAAVPDDPPPAEPPKPGAFLKSYRQYVELFAGGAGAKVIGESSTGYLKSELAVRNLHAAVPDARIVAMIRQPADRAFSAYGMFRGQGREHISFEEAVVSELQERPADDGQRRWFLRDGWYADGIERYLERFGAERVRIYRFEDLLAEPDRIVADVFELLELDGTFRPDTGTHWNATPKPIRAPWMYKVWEQPWVRSTASRIVPKSMLDRVKSAARTDDVLEQPAAVRAKLTAFYADDIRRVEALTGLDLSDWTAGTDT